MRTGLRNVLIRSSVATLVAGCAIPGGSPQVSRTPVGGDSELVSIFRRVSADTGVPSDLLAAVSWNETRFTFVHPDAHEAHSVTVGPLALVDVDVAGASPRDLHRGALLAGVTDDAARTDAEASIRAGAALLADYARGSHGDFNAALRAYGGDSFAYSVERALARGVDGRDERGARIVIAARPSTLPAGTSSVSQAAGYTGAEWIPAYSGNYQAANRGVADVKAIVIHDTEGSYAGTVSWFKDPAASVSAHYVVRSSDGHIAQMVDEKNVAYHVKCFNTNSVGIEHEGYAAKPDQWFTEAMYVESAKLTAYLADKYNIEKEHSTTAIMGHGEAPDCSDHTDPGPGWKWTHYIDLVRTGGASQFLAEDITVDAPDSLTAGEVGTVTVTVKNTGTAAWDLDATRIGTADPQDRDSAFYVEGDWIGTNRATAVDEQTPAGSPGTFTFQIQAPDVATTMVYDEAFSFVQEDVTWFGPTFHVVIQVKPDGTVEPPTTSGCSIVGSGRGSGAGALVLVLARGGALRRRRR